METIILEEVEKLLDEFRVFGDERTKIIKICDDLVKSNVLADISNALKPIIEGKNFNVSQNIPLIISAILSIVSNVEYYKTVSEDRMKFVLYCVMISSLRKYYPTVLKTIDVELLRSIYKSCIELVLLVPQTIKVNKKSCLTCIGSSFKIFSFLNKNKLLV